MRRNIILFLMLAFSCVVVSCYDDKGYYDYTEVNEIVIDELGDGYSMIFKKDTLKIKPKLLFSLDSLTPDRYEYEWKAVPGVASDLSSEVIGTEREWYREFRVPKRPVR